MSTEIVPQSIPPKLPLKRCTKCGRELPLSEFVNDKQKRDGLYSSCKACVSAHQKQDRKSRHDVYIQRERLQWEENKDAINAKRRAEYAENPDIIRNRNRNWRIANAETIREWDRKRYQREKDKRQAWHRRYYRDNKNVFRAAGYRRMARKQALPDTFTTADWEYALAYFGGCCAICGRPSGLWHKIVADHWIALDDPRPDNPGTVPANMIPMCHGINGCNNSKKSTPPKEWLTRVFGKKKARGIIDRVEEYFKCLNQPR